MKRIGKILGLGLAMGGLLMATSVSAQTEKGDWAQFGRYADANKRVTTPAKVVFMGNSITDGWWPKDSTFFIDNNFLDHQRYRPQQRRDLARECLWQHRLDGRAGEV